MTEFKFDAIGTSWKIDINKELSSTEEGSLLKNIKDRIDIFDKDYSRFRSDSLVTFMSKNSGNHVLPADADKMISLYKKMFDITSGLVTPLIGQTLVDAGYDDKYSLKKGNMVKPKSWREAMEWNEPNLYLKEPALLDFGACGKGYLVDIVSEIIEYFDIKDYCVDAGGDMRQRSPNRSLKVGLEHPEKQDMVIGVIELSNKSLCGSAGNRRKWGDLHHIINPETLTSPKDILAVWVLAERTILADILTTGLFFVSSDLLEKHFDFDYLIVYADYSVKKSDGFNADLF